MENKYFEVVSWDIENFSYWNVDVHGKCIRSPTIQFCKDDQHVELYPRGGSGLEEHLAVHIYSIEEDDVNFCGELSIIGAQGSTLWTEQVDSEGSRIEFPLGLKFEEVVSLIRTSGHPDKLTLRLKKNKLRDEVTKVRTVIQVSEVTLEINPDVLQFEGDISFIRFTHDDYDTDITLISKNVDEDERIKLILHPHTTKAFSVHTRLSFMRSNESLTGIETREHVFLKIENWTFSDSLSKREVTKDLSSLILNLKVVTGKVTHALSDIWPYFIGVKIHPDIITEKSSGKDNDRERELKALSNDFMCLYQDQVFSDLTLKCGDVTFPVHKNILGARSPVFKSMLSADMKEAASGQVDIGDLDPSTLCRFLAFLYTGAAESDLQSDAALKLYFAADKYQVHSLKRLCTDFLCSNVSLENACSVLSLGDKHGDAKLTGVARDFILDNFNAVLASKEWDTLKRSEPLLVAETLTQFGLENRLKRC